MRFWSHADSTFPLPEGHRYPLPKYRRLHDRLLLEGIARPENVVGPNPMSFECLERTHDSRYIARMLMGDLERREQKVLGLPWSPELVLRARRGAQGTLNAARDALRGDRLGMMLGGGTHHAGRASGRGYCLFNDVAIVTREVRRDRLARRVLVVDCDVHQGDGTAEFLAGDQDPEAFCVSLQCERNYPFSRIASDLDVELPAGTQDDQYLAELDTALDVALRRFGAPDLVIYLAGADPWEGDGLGRLGLTKEGLRARDDLVLDRALATGAAVVVTLAGGYPPDVEDGVDINLGTARAVARRAARLTPRRDVTSDAA